MAVIVRRYVGSLERVPPVHSDRLFGRLGLAVRPTPSRRADIHCMKAAKEVRYVQILETSTVSHLFPWLVQRLCRALCDMQEYEMRSSRPIIKTAVEMRRMAPQIRHD